jgi:hypothetical protein
MVMEFTSDERTDKRELSCARAAGACPTRQARDELLLVCRQNPKGESRPTCDASSRGSYTHTARCEQYLEFEGFRAECRILSWEAGRQGSSGLRGKLFAQG